MRMNYFLFALLMFSALASAKIYPVSYAEVCGEGCYDVTEQVAAREGFCDEGTCAPVFDEWLFRYMFDVANCRNPTLIISAMELPVGDTFYFYGWDAEGPEDFIAFRSFGEELSTEHINYRGHMPDPDGVYRGFAWYLAKEGPLIGLVDYVALSCSSDEGEGGGEEELRELSISYSQLGCPGNHLAVYAKRGSISVSNVDIKIYDSKGNVVAESKTQAGGIAYFIVNQPGVYKIEGTKSGYEDATISMYIEKLCPVITTTTQPAGGTPQQPIVPESGTTQGAAGTFSEEKGAPEETSSGLAAFSNTNEQSVNGEMEAEKENNTPKEPSVLPLALLFAGGFALLYFVSKGGRNTRRK
ncbi:MAG: hypothetical protein QXY05_00445 [Candidatus Anstonellales archaeon]